MASARGVQTRLGHSITRGRSPGRQNAVIVTAAVSDWRSFRAQLSGGLASADDNEKQTISETASMQRCACSQNCSQARVRIGRHGNQRRTCSCCDCRSATVVVAAAATAAVSAVTLRALPLEGPGQHLALLLLPHRPLLRAHKTTFPIPLTPAEPGAGGGGAVGALHCSA